tara:strand:- start:990 stop:1427 length:438 start_codon:yes stop_codon:yes gene_type:complete
MFQSNIVTARAAYGRSYKSMKAIKADYLSGKDFQCADSGRYLNCQDCEFNGIRFLNVRYKKDTMVCVLEIKKMRLLLAKAEREIALAKIQSRKIKTTKNSYSLTFNIDEHGQSAIVEISDKEKSLSIELDKEDLKRIALLIKDNS